MESARRDDENLVRPERLVKPSKTLFIVENKAWKTNGAAVVSNAIEILFVTNIPQP